MTHELPPPYRLTAGTLAVTVAKSTGETGRRLHRREDPPIPPWKVHRIEGLSRDRV